jgi:hypothetical protein
MLSIVIENLDVSAWNQATYALSTTTNDRTFRMKRARFALLSVKNRISEYTGGVIGPTSTDG